MIGVAAVLDRPMPHPLLEAISELPPAELMAGAREAVAHQVLVTDADGRYAFRHALVGEAVHGDLLPGEDTALHGRIAAALDARPQLLGDDVGPETVAAELACHWRAAHDLGRALEAGVRAGLAAARIYAFAEAQRQFERALELWPRVADAAQRAGRDRAEVLALAADCADARGETSRSAALVRDALADVDEQRDPLRAAALYERLGWYLRRSAASEESLAAFERARALLPEEPTVERARLLETHARQLMLLGDFRPTVAMTEQAIADAEATGSEITAARALMTLGFARAGLGDEVEGVEILRRAHDRTMAIGSPSDRSRAAINLSELLDLSRHTAEALTVVRAELEDSQRRPERSAYDAFMVVQEVNFLIRLGRLGEARERMPARVPGEAVSYTAMFWRDQRARLALLTGDLPALREELAEVERLHQRSAEPQWIEPRADLTAELALREDRFADARAALRRAAPLVERSDEATRLIRMAWAALRVEAEVAGRARALGEDYVPELDAVAERLLARGEGRPRFDEACAWAALARAEQGRRATLLGAAPPDPVAWQDAAVAFDALSLPVPAAYARFRAGEALVTLGDRAAAAVPLRAAQAAGAALITADVAALARRARIELDSPGRGGAARAGRLACRAARAHPARARGAAARGRGPHEPVDRRDALHEREDRLGARLADPGQARRRRPRRGGRRGAPARLDRRGGVLAAERVRKCGAVRGPRRAIALASGVRDADVDAAPVLGAHAARRQAVLFEPRDDARDRALAEMDRRRPRSCIRRSALRSAASRSSTSNSLTPRSYGLSARSSAPCARAWSRAGPARRLRPCRRCGLSWAASLRSQGTTQRICCCLMI